MSIMVNYSICASLLLLLLSPCHVSLAGRAIPSSAPSTVVRPLASEEDYGNSLRPQLDRKGQPLLQFKDCLPKGFRHASAPSRFVNFHTLGSTACNSSGVRDKKP